VHLVGPYYTTHTFVHMHTASRSLRCWNSNLPSNKHLPTEKEKEKGEKEKNCTIWRATFVNLLFKIHTLKLCGTPC